MDGRFDPTGPRSRFGNLMASVDREVTRRARSATRHRGSCIGTASRQDTPSDPVAAATLACLTAALYCADSHIGG
jgi:hypothetical protein